MLLRKTSGTVSTVELNSLELLMKAAGYTFKNFGAKFLENLSALQWMFSKEMCAPADFLMFNNDIYSYLKTGNVDFNDFLMNEEAVVYKHAKEYSLKNNKKKYQKKINKC